MHKKHYKKRKNKQPKILSQEKPAQKTQSDQTIVEVEESKQSAHRLKHIQNEVMFKLSQLYLKDGQGTEMAETQQQKNYQSENLKSLIIQESCQDITASFRALQKEMKQNQIIKSPSFILDHTMQSYQLFHPKTDFNMNMPESFNLQKQFQFGNLKPAEDLSPSELILLVDQLFLRETLFYRGYEPCQTINLCALKINQKYHQNSKAINAIIHSESYLIFKLIEIVRNCLSQREDDFHGPIIHQKFTSKTSTQIVQLFLDAEKEVEGLQKASQQQGENYKQLKIRLKFLRGTFEFIDKLTAPAQLAQKVESEKYIKQLDEKYNFLIKNSLAIEQHCHNDASEKVKRDQTRLDFINSYFDKKAVVNFPGSIQPKHVPSDLSKFAYKNFRLNVLQNLRRAIQIPSKFQPPVLIGSKQQQVQESKEKSIGIFDIKTELLSLNVQSNYNLLVRCVTEHILFPVKIDYSKNKIDPEIKAKQLKSEYGSMLLYYNAEPKRTALFNVQEFQIANLYSTVIRNIYPKVTIRKKKQKEQETIEFSLSQHGKLFLLQFELLVKVDILRNLKSRSRQHRNCTQNFLNFTNIMNQGNLADQIHQKLTGNSTHCPAINLVLSQAILAMIKHLNSIIDLDILQFSQIKQVFRYLGCIYLVGSNNNKLMMLNSLSYNHRSNNPIDFLNYLLESKTKLIQKSQQLQYFAHQWVFFSGMSFAMDGIALLMELIYRYALEKRVKNIRYPDPWLSTYSDFEEEDKAQSQEQNKTEQNIAIKMKRAAYDQRFKAFKQLPFPKFVTFDENENWFSGYKDADILLKQGKACLMKAGQIFMQMKKLQNRNKYHLSDQFLDLSSRRCILNSLNLVKLINLKEGEKIGLKFQLQRQAIPLLNFQKL